MSTNEKYLLVFSLTNNHLIDTRIKRYAQLVKHINAHKKIMPEWHVLIVVPKIPNAALQLPQVAIQAHQQTRLATKQLSQIGSSLNIPNEYLHLRNGFSDLQAWSLARENNINKVYGYSRIVTRCMRLIKRWLITKKTYSKTNINHNTKAKSWLNNCHVAELIYKKIFN